MGINEIEYDLSKNKFNEIDEDKSIFQQPSIKIIKNTKGYNFEFKILSTNIEELDRIHNLIVDKIKQWELKNGK